MEEVFELTVTTRARRRQVTQTGAGKLAIATPKVPEKGKANEDIVDMLADFFHIRKSAVEILRGHRGKKKIVRIIR